MGATSLAGKVTRFLSCRRQGSVESEESVCDVEFDFLDDGEVFMSSSSSDDQCHSLEMELDDDDDEDDEKDLNGINEMNRSFWDSQHQGLQTNVYRTSSLETKIRSATKEVIEEISASGTGVCGCSRKMMNGGTSCCKNCLMREVCRRLQKAGFNSAICKTRWKTSKDIPAGEHTFLDVIDNTNPKKGEVRVMIELNFQAEFEMARGSNEYNELIQKLPQVFVGKVERLSNLIKILCNAAKRCMKDKKMHMGPWRKHRYMQAKWLGPCERNTSTKPLPMGYSNSERIMTKQKSKASMLTMDLLDKVPTLHCAVVGVV
ncbi:uncharacterized protein LOC127082140 [Lathyrus oleraceus]|nr:uncharacterized protein LOC127082140 [Pisum sativum]